MFLDRLNEVNSKALKSHAYVYDSKFMSQFAKSYKNYRGCYFASDSSGALQFHPRNAEVFFLFAPSDAGLDVFFEVMDKSSYDGEAPKPLMKGIPKKMAYRHQLTPDSLFELVKPYLDKFLDNLKNYKG